MSDQLLKKTILILSANPRGTAPLRLDEEVREIKEGMQRSRHRERFVIEYQLAVRPKDVRWAMLNYKPQIVHFCGHGVGDRGLVLEDETGKTKVVSTLALAELFKLFSNQMECVLLNACYSEVQAKAIAQHIPYVIGMNQAITDRAAIEFATSFYDALGAGKSVDFAFRLGKNAMRMVDIPEENTPVLVAKAMSQEKGASVTQPVSRGQAFETSETTPGGGRSRIFISYKRGKVPDEAVAMEVFQALRQFHEVFIDQTMLVGTHWAKRIEAELRRSDFLISFLTQDSVNSEMVQGEIETAHHLSQQQGKPVILPVRLAYRDPFAYPLSAYLNGINWAFWESSTDTPRLIQELMQAIAGDALSINTDHSRFELISLAPAVNAAPEIPRPMPSAQPVSLEMPEGTMDSESRFYVARSSDALALSTIERAGGVTVPIKGPRQMGKSSLLIRIKAKAETVGKRVAYLDFQLFDRSALTEGDRFYRQFCEWLTEERSDFFGMLRNWHNNRAATPIWKQLDLVLVTSTEPYQLIEDLNQSPFNVGQVIELVDFDGDQVTFNRHAARHYNGEW